jgi:RNA polymerase sigma-70 factor (ECF subfamily)
MVQGAAGDRDAFHLLVQRWERPVFAFLLRMLGSPEEAQDLCQETFLRVIGSATSYEGRGQFRSWLFRIAGNQARARLRRSKILSWLPFDQDRPHPPSPEPDIQQELEARDTVQEVRQAIARLPERQRRALVLKQYHDMKYSEIAESMQLSVPAVQMLLHRAMQALRKEFSSRGGRP